MTNRLRTGIFLLVLAQGLAGCSGSDSPSPSPSPSVSPSPIPPAPPGPSLFVFTEPFSHGLSTTDVRDAQDQIIQFNSAGELIWTPDGTRLRGYRVGQDGWGNRQYWIEGKICPEVCFFVVRFGTKDGERRAYLTVDYIHDNNGTLVDVEVEGGALVVTGTDLYPPGAPTLSGVVTEMRPTGPVPIEGAEVTRGVQGGWVYAITDRNGFYRIQGLYDSTDDVYVFKEGFQTDKRNVAVAADTRLDIELVRR